MRRTGYFLPPAAWMAVIFVFSTSLFSSEETGRIIEPIIKLVYPDASRELVEILHHLIRKAAHLTEYLLLSLLWFRALIKGAGWSPGRAVLSSFLISAAYAATDEIHQSFVPGRTSSPIDVLIDASGAAIGMAITGLITKKRGRKATPFVSLQS